MNEFINITKENIKDEHLCCIIRTKKQHPGVEAKRRWLSERLDEGHIFRKLNAKATVFIEYAPLESSWVPVVGENYLYIYCLWTLGEYRTKGYGKELMEYCIKDAKEKGKSGICMLGAKKQKAWFTDQNFAKKFGFETVDSTNNGYELLALSFDGYKPLFAQSARKEKIAEKGLVIYYSNQCPYTHQSIETLKSYCHENSIQSDFILIDTLDKAKNMPCIFNNFAVFYNGEFKTVNLLDIVAIKRIIGK